MAQVRQWDTFEASLPGPSSGNPYVDIELTATPLPGTVQGAATIALPARPYVAVRLRGVSR